MGGIAVMDGTGGGVFAEGVRGLRRSLTLWGLGIAATVMSFLVLGVVVSLPGLGLLVLPAVVGGVRRVANRQRELAGAWSGEPVPVPYTPEPAGKGLLARCRWIAQDTQTWRDWLWVTLDPVVGVTLAFLPIGLILSGFWGMGLAFFGAELSAEWDGLWFDFIPVEGPRTAVLAGVLGVLHLPLALWLAPRTVRAHGAWTRSLLAPSEVARMADRIEHLSVTRSDAVDTQMAEIRRIERDLHDGAQARLVAMGMTLDAAEHLLDSNPEAVRSLLIEARKSSSKALEELRDLVRGIHPPVLADRGLADAVRALALVSPLTAEVVVDLPGRPEPPVESAVYFAVSEILANAAKHSGGDRVWVDLRYDRGMLRVGITDDGRGGADIARGTGLRGIERRLATFDGVLAVSSPLNGPTLVTMEIPCVLSSPKTTSC
ncbi:sensor domain-containing protein [Streptomyces sp. HU2014]|uniref:sensor histidine kinase n=1 Tax=Streptomyces sp. HU2014 TaxID=2939414 RepID=UPI00200DC935|nr:sensor domain-containing protein [Streptomyces sp. HU2014]UQI48260.1 sensor domain-containing protein [Streptomyces sp. HU2014]